MYTIFDIETSGGKYGEEKIIEIALYKYDGETIVDSFSTLVNPEKSIHFYVKKLTGISEKMVKRAPKFHEIAKRIVEITENSVLVAHNASFDYRMLRQEFKSLGYNFQAEILDTIPLSKALIPNQQHYSLGKLCKNLGIALLDEHRAFGDAMATLELFKLLLEKDTEKQIIQKNIFGKNNESLSKYSEKIWDNLPNKCGVYYFLNNEGKIIYIGKSLNIKNRVRQHFTAKDKKSIKIQIATEKVEFEITGSELIALIKESTAIKKIKPLFNRAQRKTLYVFGLYKKTTEKGYISLYIDKISADKKALLSFENRIEAKNILYKITEKYSLCQAINGLYKTTNHCFQYTTNECFGACINQESTKNYNERVNQLIQSFQYKNKDIIVQDKGKEVGEKSFIVIENGILCGYGYYRYNYQINTKNKLKKRMVMVDENQDLRRIVKNYLVKYPKKEIEIL